MEEHEDMIFEALMERRYGYRLNTAETEHLREFELNQILGECNDSE